MNTLRRISRHTAKAIAAGAVLVAAALPLAVVGTAGAASTTPTITGASVTLNTTYLPAQFAPGFSGTLTVYGTNFVGTLASETVTTNAPGVTFSSSAIGSTTQFTTTLTSTTATPVGFYSLTVTDANGTFTLANAFSVVATPVSVTSTTGASVVAQGMGSGSIALVGTGFISGDTVTVAPVTGATLPVVGSLVASSPTAATIAVTTSALTTPGTYTLVITDQNTGGTVTTPLTIIGTTVTAVAPSAGLGIPASGSSVQTVTITGTGFLTGATVAISGGTAEGGNVTLGTVTVASATSITVPVTVASTATVGQVGLQVSETAAGNSSTFTTAPTALGIGEAGGTLGTSPTPPAITANSATTTVPAATSSVQTFTATGDTAFPITTGSVVTLTNGSLTLSGTVTAVTSGNVATVSVVVPRYAYTTITAPVTNASGTFTVPSTFLSLPAGATNYTVVDTSTGGVIEVVNGTGNNVTHTVTLGANFAQSHAAGTVVEFAYPTAGWILSINNGANTEPGANAVALNADGALVSTIAKTASPVVAPGAYSDTVTLPGFNFTASSTVTFGNPAELITGTVASASGDTATLNVTIPSKISDYGVLASAPVAGQTWLTFASAPTTLAAGTVITLPSDANTLDTEAVTVASTYTAGSTVIPLTTALKYNHAINITQSLEPTWTGKAQLTGPVVATFFNGSGLYDTGGTLFTLVGAATVSGVSQNVLQPGATNVAETITGTGFSTTAANDVLSSTTTGVTFGAVTAATATSLTTTVSVASTAVATASVNVSVKLADGTNAGSNGSTQVLAIVAGPVVTSAANSATGALTAGEADTITLTGTGFAANDTITFTNGTDTTDVYCTMGIVTFGSATSIGCALTVNPAAPAGTYSVTVTAPTASGAGSSTLATGVTVSAPVITAVSPASVGNGYVGTFTLTGTGFPTTTGVTCAASAPGLTVSACAITSATSITVTVTSTAEMTSYLSPASVKFTITTSATGSTQALSPAFAVVSNPGAIVATPSAIVAGNTGLAVTITGTGFQPGATVTFGETGLSATVTSITGNTIKATVVATAAAAAGNTTITVNNSNGGFSTAAANFVVSAAPTITSVNSLTVGSVASVGSGSTSTLTIWGTGFATGAVVSSPVAGFATFGTATVVSATEITVSVKVVPNTGLAPISSALVVTNTDGSTAKLLNGLVVNVAPTVSGTYYVPTASTNAQVVITGTGFQNGMTMTSSNSAYTVGLVGNTGTTATLLVSTTYSDDRGTSTNITFTNPDGSTVSFPLNGGTPAPVISTPTATSVTGTAKIGASRTLIIHGTGFVGTPAVTSNNGSAKIQVLSVSSTRIAIKITLKAGSGAGTRKLTVTNADTGAASVSYTQAK